MWSDEETVTKEATTPRTIVEQMKLVERLHGKAGRVWGYIRVSTEGQEEGQSPEVQEAGIRKFCEEQKLDPPEFVFEQASAKNSAIPIAVPRAPGSESPELTPTSPRPLLFMLLGYICERQGHLVVWKLDRLARLAYEQELILDLLTRKGARLHSTQRGEQDMLDRGKDDSDPSRMLFRQVIAAVNQYERRVIEMRMRTGIQLKASKGEWVGGSRPFGYDTKGQELVINPTAVRTVQLLFYMRDLCGETMARIAERLNNEFKVPGGGWHKVRVSRVLQNRKAYLGIYVDPYGVPHNRPDIRMLPAKWDTWLEANGLAPSDAKKKKNKKLSTLPSEEGIPVYGETP